MFKNKSQTSPTVKIITDNVWLAHIFSSPKSSLKPKNGCSHVVRFSGGANPSSVHIVNMISTKPTSNTVMYY